MQAIREINPDIIIVGAGITGCTIANVMGNRNWKVLILEKRNMIGGNCADIPYDNYYIHKHGPHVIHTSDKEVWNFLNEFTKLNSFIYSPLIKGEGYDKELFNLPYNMNLFSKFFKEYNPDKIKELINEDINKSIKKYKLQNDNIKNLEEQAISLVGEKMFKAFVEKYTEKQWGKKCDKLPVELIKRIPFRFTYNNNYYNDQYQGIPMYGYTNMMTKMLASENIVVRLGINFKELEKEIMEYVENKDIPIVYTGPIDELFDYKYGYLEWRSVRFENEIVNTSNYQGVSIINYADSKHEYTRTIEHKHFYCLNQNDINKFYRSYISKEIPIKWEPGLDPYYPLDTKENIELLRKYETESDKWKNLYLIGRLAEYKYKDIGPSINDAIKLSWELIHDFKKNHKC